MDRDLIHVERDPPDLDRGSGIEAQALFDVARHVDSGRIVVREVEDDRSDVVVEVALKSLAGLIDFNLGEVARVAV